MDAITTTVINLIMSANKIALMDGETIMGTAPAAFDVMRSDGAGISIPVRACVGAATVSGLARDIALLAGQAVIQRSPMPEPVALRAGQEFALSSFTIEI